MNTSNGRMGNPVDWRAIGLELKDGLIEDNPEGASREQAADVIQRTCQRLVVVSRQYRNSYAGRLLVMTAWFGQRMVKEGSVDDQIYWLATFEALIEAAVDQEVDQIVFRLADFFVMLQYDIQPEYDLEAHQKERIVNLLDILKHAEGRSSTDIDTYILKPLSIVAYPPVHLFAFLTTPFIGREHEVMPDDAAVFQAACDDFIQGVSEGDDHLVAGALIDIIGRIDPGDL